MSEADARPTAPGYLPIGNVAALDRRHHDGAGVDAAGAGGLGRDRLGRRRLRSGRGGLLLFRRGFLLRGLGRRLGLLLDHLDGGKLAGRRRRCRRDGIAISGSGILGVGLQRQQTQGTDDERTLQPPTHYQSPKLREVTHLLIGRHPATDRVGRASLGTRPRVNLGPARSPNFSPRSRIYGKRVLAETYPSISGGLIAVNSRGSCYCVTPARCVVSAPNSGKIPDRYGNFSRFWLPRFPCLTGLVCGVLFHPCSGLTQIAAVHPMAALHPPPQTKEYRRLRPTPTNRLGGGGGEVQMRVSHDREQT